MIIDFWMILVFLVVFGIWSEWRNYSGKMEGLRVGIEHGITMNQGTRDALKQEQGILFTIRLFEDKGLIIVSENGIVTGYNNTQFDVQGYVKNMMKGTTNDINTP